MINVPSTTTCEIPSGALLYTAPNLINSSCRKKGMDPDSPVACSSVLEKTGQVPSRNQRPARAIQDVHQCSLRMAHERNRFQPAVQLANQHLAVRVVDQVPHRAITAWKVGAGEVGDVDLLQPQCVPQELRAHRDRL